MCIFAYYTRLNRFMKHSILILAHNNIRLLLQMINCFDSDFYIYIHLDKKCHVSCAEIEALFTKKNIVYFSKKYNINWGGHNLLKAELYLLRKAIQDGDYYHFISGQDFPIVSLSEFKLFFKRNVGCIFLEYAVLPMREWDSTSNRFDLFWPYDLFDARAARAAKILSRIIALQRKWNLCRKMPISFNALYGGSAWFSY